MSLSAEGGSTGLDKMVPGISRLQFLEPIAGRRRYWLNRRGLGYGLSTCSEPGLKMRGRKLEVRINCFQEVGHAVNVEL